MFLNTVITGTGSYIPKIIKKNSDFSDNLFLDEDGSSFPHDNQMIIEKFKAITGIEERRYASDQFTSSDLGYMASEKAIRDAKVDKEKIDYLIVAHNFGDIKKNTIQTDIVPSLASRIKNRLGIKNPNCVAYDILFGCPGWIEGLIQAHAFIKSGIAKKILVVGTETLSRVLDEHDRDSMIYSDGAGACIVEAKEESKKRGVLGHATRTDTFDEAYFLHFGKSYNPSDDSNVRYLKMLGRKIYEHALSFVPEAMKKALDQAKVKIQDLKKIFIHQANEKMDEAIVKRFYKLYHFSMPENIMPMNIHLLGNSSVATVPTLFDSVLKKELANQVLKNKYVLLFASVGAGMNINAVVYKM